MLAPGIHGWREHVHPKFLKDTSKKDLVTRAGRLGGRRYNRFSLQVESVYSDYLRVAIPGNGNTQSNKPRIYSDKNLTFSNKNLRYGLEIMSCVAMEPTCRC
jgi:hypothetical protein